MKESFIFYKSFYEAIEELDDKKQLKLYKAITKFALKNEECDDLLGIEKAIFALIKPQIVANNKRFEDGKKGGRPRKQKTTGFDEEKTTGFENKKPKVNVNVNENNNENVNANENISFFNKEEKKLDPFINPIKTFFISEYEKVFSTKPFLSQSDCNRLTELAADNQDIREAIPIAIGRLKGIEFSDINFKPSANWLLKGNNFERVMNGEFEKQETWEEKFLRKAQEDDEQS